MDDEMLELTTRSDVEVVRRLEAFADLRLSPSVAARTRIRAAVMDAARERAATIAAADANEVAVHAAATTTRVVRPAWRRPMAAFAAATLTLGLLAGSALASSPGGPLYAARLWAEVANLPQSGNARAQAEAQRLGQRVAEVQQASAASDESATEAALTAYSSILAEATSGSAGDPEAEKTLQVAVTRHIAVLTALADRVPAPAQAAIERALASSTAALDGLNGAGGGSGTSGGNGGGTGGGTGTGGNPGGAGGEQGNPGGNGDPAKSAEPGAGKPSAKPDKPAPAPTTKPARTTHPDPTPRNGPNGPPATGGPNASPHKGPAQ
jgi:hypothetical protein